MHEQSCFITLTYDDDHLPKNKSLSVRTCQLFVKKLRAKISPIKIKFYLAGEYGEKLGRPHYHALIFGWRPPDATLWKSNGDISLYLSEMLKDIWGGGFVSFGAVSFDSACYVANYTLKKITGKKAKAHYGKRIPEFSLMSRGGRGKSGGIGKAWIKKFKSDVYPSDEIIANGIPARPPRYYDRVTEQTDPEMMEKIKTKREGEAGELHALVLKSGHTVMVAESANARRLAVRETVATAKAELKKRRLK